MNELGREQLARLLKDAHIKSRIVKELRFVPEEIKNWGDLDMLAVPTRGGNEGVLMVQASRFYVLPYELNTKIKDKSTGRSKRIICDFCCTWQQGGKSGRITFIRKSNGHSFTYLCCGDLRCSLHVRDKTPEAALSRAQLHEDINTERRITRLKDGLSTIMNTVGAEPVPN